jgi:hypothetical protein
MIHMTIENNDKAAVAERGASVAPEKAISKNGASQKGAPKAKPFASNAASVQPSGVAALFATVASASHLTR